MESKVIHQRVGLVKTNPSKSLQQAKSILLLLKFLPDLYSFLWGLEGALLEGAPGRLGVVGPLQGGLLGGPGWSG